MVVCGRIFKDLFKIRVTNSLNEKGCKVEWKKFYSKVRSHRVNFNENRKPNLKTMKFESANFKACITPEVKLISNLLAKEGHELRIVGGAVRDLLLGLMPEDVDLSTTAIPDEMKNIFNENNIRLINSNGEKHGTITVRINEKNYEITTLRVDKITDGRHAEVEFTKDWLLDASRRDLTINAMYLGLDGTLYDYFNGREDLMNHRVAFVGDAYERLCEDYLRILRYFRFYGKIATTPDNHDEDVLKAIKDVAKGLEIISGERILVELNKILSGRFSGELLQKIISLGIGSYIGFPENCYEVELRKVYDRLKLKNVTVKPFTLLASIFQSKEEFLECFVTRVKPSKAERDLGAFIIINREEEIHPDIKKYFLLLSLKNKIPHNLLLFQTCELLKYLGRLEQAKALENMEFPKFPLNGNHLIKANVLKKRMTEALAHLKKLWIEKDYMISEQDLLKQIPSEYLKTESLPPIKKTKQH